jgi:hypothetical protein
MTPGGAVKMTEVWSFPPLLRLIDWIKGMRERELGHGKLHCSSPRPLSTFYMDNMIETHNYELVGTLDQA